MKNTNIKSDIADRDNLTLLLSVKEKLIKSLADRPTRAYEAVMGMDRKKYIYEHYDRVRLIRFGNDGIEEELFSDSDYQFKRNLDQITKEEVKMVRAYNKISCGNLQKMFFELEKAQRLHRDHSASTYRIAKLQKELDEEIKRAERLEEQIELTDYSEMKRMNEHLKNVGFYKGKPYYNETKNFFGEN